MASTAPEMTNARPIRRTASSAKSAPVRAARIAARTAAVRRGRVISVPRGEHHADDRADGDERGEDADQLVGHVELGGDRDDQHFGQDHEHRDAHEEEERRAQIGSSRGPRTPIATPSSRPGSSGSVWMPRSTTTNAAQRREEERERLIPSAVCAPSERDQQPAARIAGEDFALRQDAANRECGSVGSGSTTSTSALERPDERWHAQPGHERQTSRSHTAGGSASARRRPRGRCRP